MLQNQAHTSTESSLPVSFPGHSGRLRNPLAWREAARARLVNAGERSLLVRPLTACGESPHGLKHPSGAKA